MKRYNVDMGMLHEEADGPWLPGGELNNDWVSNILAFVLIFFLQLKKYFHSILMIQHLVTLIVCEADLYILTLYVSGLVTLPCSIKRYNSSILTN